MMSLVNNKEYFEALTALKQEIKTTRLRAHMSINVEQFFQNLRHEFPKMTELSTLNLVYMQTFAAAYPDYEFAQQPAAQIHWGHIKSA